MNRSYCLALVLALALVADNSHAAKCSYFHNESDPETGVWNVQTKWNKLVTMFSAGGETIETTGAVSAITRDGQEFLRIRLETTDYFPVPAEFAVQEDPTWDPAHRDFLDSLLGYSIVFPEGSALRIDLDDRSTIVLRTVKHRRIRADYTVPGAVPGTRNTEQTAAKGLVGLLGKVADKALESEGVESENVTSPHYFVQSTAYVDFPLDEEASRILRRASVTGMRVESRDRYYTLGWRSPRYEVVAWSKKSYPAVRDALACVDQATGGRK